MVHIISLLLATAAVFGSVSAAPTAEPNPFEGKDRHVVGSYGKKLEKTITAFEANNDTLNAARTRTVQQKISTFTWVTSRAHLSNITTTIAEARQQKKAGKEMIVGLVLYNLPDRDCAAGESAGELQLDNDGYRIYKSQFVDKYAKLVKEAKDLTFAIVVEPDSLANAVTNQGLEACAKATPYYEQGIAYAISKLQATNIHLYLDAAHGGWLGWGDNLKPTAQVFAKVLAMAKELNAKSRSAVMPPMYPTTTPSTQRSARTSQHPRIHGTNLTTQPH